MDNYAPVVVLLVLEVLEVDVVVELVVVVVELVVEVELVEVLVLEVDDDVDVQVKSEFPNKNSLIVLSSIFSHNHPCPASSCPPIKSQVVLYRKNP